MGVSAKYFAFRGVPKVPFSDAQQLELLTGKTRKCSNSGCLKIIGCLVDGHGECYVRTRPSRCSQLRNPYLGQDTSGCVPNGTSTAVGKESVHFCISVKVTTWAAMVALTL